MGLTRAALRLAARGVRRANNQIVYGSCRYHRGSKSCISHNQKLWKCAKQKSGKK